MNVEEVEGRVLRVCRDAREGHDALEAVGTNLDRGVVMYVRGAVVAVVAADGV